MSWLSRFSLAQRALIGLMSIIALLFGAELDAEMERARELQGGLPAEESIQLPPRDTRKSDKTARQHEEDLAKARELRADSKDGQDRPDGQHSEDRHE